VSSLCDIEDLHSEHCISLVSQRASFQSSSPEGQNPDEDATISALLDTGQDAVVSLAGERILAQYSTLLKKQWSAI